MGWGSRGEIVGLLLCLFRLVSGGDSGVTGLRVVLGCRGCGSLGWKLSLGRCKVRKELTTMGKVFSEVFSKEYLAKFLIFQQDSHDVLLPNFPYAIYLPPSSPNLYLNLTSLPNFPSPYSPESPPFPDRQYNVFP